MIRKAAIDGWLGRLVLTEEGGLISRLVWGGAADVNGSELLTEACRQLEDYFAGRRQVFDLPLKFEAGLIGEVQRAMCAIPFGETRTYGDLARALGAPAQAIGQACGANPVPILIPCHRILAASGLGGYSGSGGIETKVALLRLEGAASLLI
jgi:methylated-DNA-[protein]-cysteine S-methyltransferase